MTALRYDLKVKQGADYVRTIPVLDGKNVTGWTVAGQVRDGLAPTAALLHTLDVTITVDGTAIVLRIPKATSSAWAWRLGRYDVELTAPDGGTSDFLWGSVVVYPETTHPDITP